jgi:S-formylglutathione hydrolase
MKRLLLLALVACGNGAQAPAQAPAPASTPVVSTPVATKGSVVTEKFQSDALGVEKDVRVYLPAGYDPAGTKRWPVLYYLHGLGGDETNWIEMGKLDGAADELGLGAIVVMPDGDNNFYVDSAKSVDYDACMKDGTGLFIAKQPRRKTCAKTSKYETYITRDLVGWVDRTYKTIATREGRGIAGLSMGGYGALILSMRHPDMFAAAASHSGVDALLYSGPFPYEQGKATLLDDVKQWGAGFGTFGAWIRGLYGADLATWRAHDPAALVEKLAPSTLKLYLDCGTEDEFALHNGMQYLHDLLLARKIDHEYYIGPGRHDFDFWAARLPKSLAFLRANVAAAK